MISRFDRRSGKTSRSNRSSDKRRDYNDDSRPRSRRGLSENTLETNKGNRFNKRSDWKKRPSNSNNKNNSFNDYSSKDRREFIRSNRDNSRPIPLDSSSINNSRTTEKPRYIGRRNSISSSRENSPNQFQQRREIESENFYKSYSLDKEFTENSLKNDLVWGRHSSQSTLESGRPIHRIWCTAELRSTSKFLQLLKDAKSSGVLVEEVTWARLGQLTGGAVHQGIVLQTSAAETLDLSSLIKGCDLLEETPLILALDGLKDPHNLGAIVRSAEALGAHGLVIPQRRSAGLTGSVAKVAAGALEHLPVARVVNLNRSLDELKKAGYRVIGLAEEGDTTLEETDLDGPLVVVTGSEDKGISLLTRRHCDQLVRIPLRGVTPSLNASVATSLVLYEIARRGWMKGVLGQSPSPRMTRAKCFSLKAQDPKNDQSSSNTLD